MTDRYERIRAALAMGPTPGPWKWWEYEDLGYCCVNPRDGGLLIAKCDVRNPFDPEQRANAALIAACDPDTIRALLAERDALAAALEEAREDADKLREMLRTVSAVGIVNLFGTARDDVLAEFSLAELQEISRVTEHKRPEQVERIYREEWDAAIDQARGKGVAGGA